ncbi:MAG: type IV secretory system conjugative DNA transfer family protein [Pseudomonadota bacterium]
MHVAARLHAFGHGLFRPSEQLLTKEVYAKTQRLFRRHELLSATDREHQAFAIAAEVLEHCGRGPDPLDVDRLARFILRLFDYERLFKLPDIDWSDRRSVSEWWTLRDELNRQRKSAETFDETREILTTAISLCCFSIWKREPTIGARGDGVAVTTPRVRAIPEINETVGEIVATIFAKELADIGLLTRLSDRIERNVIAASGGNPNDPGGFSRVPRLPERSDIRDPAELVRTYLGGTPLAELFDGEIPVSIPNEARFAHHHIVAGSGHGKTQTLQFLIAEDLKAVARGERSVVVIDSQGDLIRNLAPLKLFAPGEPLHDRLVLIDPTDVEYPVSLNLFDVGQTRLAGCSQLERERLQNSILELYDFVLGTLLSAEMTQKQNVIFRYVTRLMLHIPDATIHTLRELMEPGSQVKFAAHIERLQGTARHFFETEFSSKEFEATKKQVLRRLWGILENQIFERMFSHPRSKLDLFAEMNAGKVILINTAKDLLKEQGTEIFGRFFIALIAQAAQERATLPNGSRTPTFVYIDEAADYFDRNIGIILSQARKYNVGMVLAHQYLGQLEPKLMDGIAANTAVKFAGGVSNKDARVLGPMLGCDAALIEAQPKLYFAASIRGVTKAALPLQFPYGHLEELPRLDEAEGEALRAAMRERYAVHYTDLRGTDTPAEEHDREDERSGAEANEQADDTVRPKDSKQRSTTEKPPRDGDPGTDATPSW